MREQHMRLFVFRGVSEGTVFEPQTRKEISKIAWYNIRDLPGFKKKGVEQGYAANKFYMVAPFLGPLKKWISGQRRSDVEEVATPGAGLVPVDMEEGVEVLEEQVLGEPVVDQSADLRRLLSLGALAETITLAPQPPPVPSESKPSTSLLDLLRGGPPKATSAVPQAPMDPVNAFPTPSEMPQPHHPRHALTDYPQQQSAPHFPFNQ
ncbi:mRNA-decapping enzyme subunit 2, partial [Teratosphaeriaceae sp. CCFEE 6253]